MKYCNTCHINFNSPLEACPFCSNKLTTLDATPLSYHYPPFKKKRHVGHAFEKIIQFLFLIANLFCLVIDFFITKPNTHWSLYVLSSSLFLYVSLSIWKGNRTFLNRLILFLLLTDLFLISISYITNTPHWAIDIIFPITLIAINFFLLFFLFGHPKRMHDYGIYVVAISLLGIVPALLLLAGYLVITWPSITCGLYSGITLLGLFFFSSKTTKEELKRRFYF